MTANRCIAVVAGILVDGNDVDPQESESMSSK